MVRAGHGLRVALGCARFTQSSENGGALGSVCRLFGGLLSVSKELWRFSKALKGLVQCSEGFKPVGEPLQGFAV